MASSHENQSFGEFLHRGDPGLLHPVLARRNEQAQEIISRSSLIEVPKDINPLLVPQSCDQGLVLTPFDEFEGLSLAIPPKEYIEGWESEWGLNIKLANRGERIAAMRILEEQGFRSPGKLPLNVIDKALERGVILQLADLGQNPDLMEEHILADRQVHRTDALRNGPFSFVGRKVRSFIGLGAMPDINGSVLALATAAKMHMLAEVPHVGVFSNPDRQSALAKFVLDYLNENDPFLQEKSGKERQFILEHWRSAVVGVLEVDEYKALARAEKLAEAGVVSYRVYGHTQGIDVGKTTRSLRRKYPRAEIFASQITNVRIAKMCEEAGADAVIIGVGSGGRCTTADLAQLIPSNAALAWKLRGELGIPVIGEGGAIDEPVIAILVGMSGTNGSGSIGGGTFESPGGIYFLTDGKDFLKPYGGEASPRTKWLSGRTYPNGLPYFPEGEQTLRALVPLEESMTQKVIKHWERIVLGAVVLGINAGPSTVSAMQNMNPSPLWEKSPTVQYLQRTH